MRFFLSLVFALAFNPAFAQDRKGNNTAGEWITTHYKTFGLWDSACDKRETDGVLEQRCYIRYVDVYSLAPKFGAVFTFVTPEPQGHRIEFGFERGARYAENGFRIEQFGAMVWMLEDPCLRTQSCVFRMDRAAAIIKEFWTGGELVQEFTDRHGQNIALLWDLDDFAAVLADFEAETALRRLR